MSKSIYLSLFIHSPYSSTPQCTPFTVNNNIKVLSAYNSGPQGTILVALALECGVPDAVCHIIATHAGEGDLVKRSTEAIIVHHADFMAYEPFRP